MKYLPICFLLSCTTIFAQVDSLQILEEVKLYGNFSKKLNAGYQIQILSDSTINNEVQSLGNLLQKNANLYFKQNGNGMVSSISLRGSGASHTGVYWNGIAINSSLNGQTDFNTLSANGFNQIEIRKGSGTTLFGSGAIGGAINLKDNISFSPSLHKEFRVNFGFASYNTKNIFVQAKLTQSNFHIKLSVEGEKSENDYPFLDTEISNENGAYKNHQIKSVFGYKINSKNQIKLFTHYNYNNRELSRSISAPSKNLYKNTENKLLVNWLHTGNQFNSNFDVAYLHEKYKFFLDKNYTDFLFGEAKSYITKYNFRYFLKKQMSFLVGLENKYTKGNGSSILNENRNLLESYILFHHQIKKNIIYNISVRNGKSTIFTIPFIYALDSKLIVSPNISLRANYSTNYKIPTFNDLYWEYSGNLNLIPETSTSKEIGTDYKTKNFTTSIVAYQTNSTNLIQWQPVTPSFWKPVNVQSVISTGAEFDLNYTYSIKEYLIGLNTQYAYNQSIDKKTNKQLIYMPYHKINTNLNIAYKGWALNYNYQYNGQVFTTTSNTQNITNFSLKNVSLQKQLIKYKVNIGFYINNLFNENYQIVANRPMPNRNYKLNINIKL